MHCVEKKSLSGSFEDRAMKNSEKWPYLQTTNQKKKINSVHNLILFLLFLQIKIGGFGLGERFLVKK